jgi:hypothetical protein
MADTEQPTDRATAVYFYDRDTGEYRGMMPAHSDPISGEPMLPACATFLRPPDATPHTAAIFSSGGWQLAQDNRGSYVADVSTKLIERVDAIGPIADKYMLVSEDDAKSIADHPEYWQPADGKLVQLDELERAAVHASILREHKRSERDGMFRSVDWRMDRLDDQTLLNKDASDDKFMIAHYRDYLRNFTNSQDWWTSPIKTFEQFEDEHIGGEQ